MYKEEHEFSSCLCGGMRRNVSSKHTVRCIECNRLQHVNCYTTVGNMPEDISECKITCAVCRFRVLDPFYPLSKVLWMKNMSGTTEKILLETDNVKHWRSENKEVLIFCINIDTQNLATVTLKQEWPRTLTLKVNGTVVEKILEPTWEHKRRDSPLKITHTLKAGSNNIDMNMTNYDIPKTFVIAFLLCKTESEENIIERVILNSSLNFKDAKQRIIKLLSKNDDEDDEVMCMEVSRKINLNCPLTFDRILVPCRGKVCSHIQCFDLKSFINITKKTKAFNNRWKCPICSFFVRPKDLVIDTYITFALSQVPKHIKEIEINKEGEIITTTTIRMDQIKDQSWDTVDVSSYVTAKCGSTPEQRNKTNENVSANSISRSSPTQNTQNTTTPEEIIIIDSDDDESESGNGNDVKTLITHSNLNEKPKTESFKGNSNLKNSYVYKSTHNCLYIFTTGGFFCISIYVLLLAIFRMYSFYIKICILMI